MNDRESPVTHIFDAYRNAVAARDIDAFMALYDDDIHMFDTWDAFEQTGADAWRAAVTDWFGSHPQAVFDMRFDHVHAMVGEDVAIIHAVATFTVITSGSPSHQQVNRFTAGLERKDGAWKIVHEHTSLPISYETGSGMFPQSAR